jgi:hypothetical protein
VEAPTDGEAVHRQLGAVHVLLDERVPRPRLGDRELDRGCELGALVDERQPLLALAIGGLDDGRQREIVCARDSGAPTRLGHARFAEALPLALLGDCERSRLGRKGMWQPEVCRYAGGDRDGPVDPRRDDAVHALGAGELEERPLVLRGHDGPAIGELEPGCRRIAVERDDEEAAAARGLQQAELGRTGPQDE